MVHDSLAATGLPRALVVLALLLGSGCDIEIVGPGAPLDQPFTLAVGESVVIDASGVRLHFVGVRDDSRCPADALCIHEGEAIVAIRLTTITTVTYDLRIGGLTFGVVTHRPFRITLRELQPYPFGMTAIRPDEYRATFLVTRL